MAQHNLKIGHINIFHIVNKLPDLCVFLNDDNEPYHLFGVTETRLNNNIPDEVIHVPNFTVFRRDPISRGETGTAIYVHQSLQGVARRRPDLESDEVECMWIELKPPQRSSLFVGFLYRNPAATFEWYDHFLYMFDRVCDRNPDVLLMGDFNIDFLKPHPAWESTTTALGLHQLVTSPTRVTSSSSTLIDHIYSNKPNAVSNVQVNSLAISDHSPISCTWSTKLPKPKKNGHTCINFRSFKRFDENRFLTDLNNTSFDSVYEETDPNTALQVWYDMFLPVLNKHAPLRQKRVKSRILPAWLSKEIIDAMEIRDEFRRQKMFVDFKRERNRVRSMVRQAKKSHIDKLIQNEKNVSALWRAMAVVTGGKCNKPQGVPSHLSADDFNNHFLSVADSLAPPRDNTLPYTCSEKLTNFCEGRGVGAKPFTVPLLAVHEVGKLISLMPSKKSAGPDEISAKILKLSLPYIVETLTYIYNLCIQHNTFPDRLKHAKVVPIPKAKDNSNVNNYRPISLVSILGKPLERHIHKHLTSYVENHQLLHSLQSGFRKNHSCHTAIARLTDTWLNAINNSELSGAVFLDLQKAFDLVDHEILLSKLRLYLGHTGTFPPSNCLPGASGAKAGRSLNPITAQSNASSLFESYLSDRKQYVLVNGASSSSGIVRRGVPQGSVLGPLLFCIFINDLPLHLSDPKTSCDLFADDATLHTPDINLSTVSSRLQQGLVQVSDWCRANSMVLNPNKTKCMVVTTRQKHQLKPLTLDLSLYDQTITQVNEHKLLGVTIDNQLKWQSHIDRTCKTISRNLYMLSKLKLYVDTNSRLLFYNAHIKSHIDYASTVWDGSSDIHLKRLNSLHRRAAKLILPDPSLSTDQKFDKLDILPLDKHLLFNKGVMMFKIRNETQPKYLCELFSRHESPYSNHRQHFNVPRPRIDIYKTSLSFSGPSFWNRLPSFITNSISLHSFKGALLKWLSSTS